MRAHLEERYTAAFGTAWPMAPWGTPWPDVLQEALEADEQYAEAEQVLRDIHQSFRRAEALLKRRGLMNHVERRSHAPEDCIGLTLPESELLRYYAAANAPFANAAEAARAAVDYLDASPVERLEAARQPAHRISISSLRELRELLNDELRRGASRRGPIGVWLAGAPPRSFSPNEWQRRTVLQLLDAYPLRDIGDPHPLTKDREIALVTLLVGTLENVETSDLQNLAWSEILNKEAKAVGITRQRRGLQTTLKQLEEKRRSAVDPQVELEAAAKQDGEEVGHFHRAICAAWGGPLEEATAEFSALYERDAAESYMEDAFSAAVSGAWKAARHRATLALGMLAAGYIRNRMPVDAFYMKNVNLISDASDEEFVETLRLLDWVLRATTEPRPVLRGGVTETPPTATKGRSRTAAKHDDEPRFVFLRPEVRDACAESATMRPTSALSPLAVQNAARLFALLKANGLGRDPRVKRGVVEVELERASVERMATLYNLATLANPPPRMQLG